MNRLRPDGTPNLYFSIRRRPRSELHGRRRRRHPGVQPASCTRWRDLPNGARADENINKQNALVADERRARWLGLQGALTYNENKVKENLYGYSDGGIITKGVLDGVINPFGDQSAAGTALLNSAALTATSRTPRAPARAPTSN
jgi:iron complex outermembrane receptor protein